MPDSGSTFQSKESELGILYRTQVIVERAVPSDAPDIAKLIDDKTKLVFGDVDIDELLCKGLLTLVVRDLFGNITTAVSLNCYPNVPTLCSSHWQRWISSLFRIDGLSPKNALWVHLVVHNITCDANFLKPILEKIFYLYPYYKYCLFLLPPGSQDLTVWFKRHTLRVLPIGHFHARKVLTLRIAHQMNFVKNYKVRRAVEEDNDDLVPLINSHAPSLKQFYGDFYIAEILKKHSDSGRQIIVAEHQTQAVAVLILNDIVNVKSLNKYFELEPFYGLCKPSDKDIATPAQIENKSQLTKCEEEEDESDEEEEERKNMMHDDIEEENTYSFSSSESSSSQTAKIISASALLDQIIQKAPMDPVILDDIKRIVTKSRSSENIDTSSSSEFSIDIDMGDSSNEFESKQTGGEFKSLYDKDMSLLKLTEETTPGLIYGHSDAELDKLIQYSLSVKTDDEIVESSPIVESSDITEYFGESNAFAVELVAAWPSHEQALFHLLTTCFECYTAKDMCILTLPSTVKPFPLLQHFVRATPRNMSNYPHELYIVHKNSIACFLNIRLAKKYDLFQINTFLSSIQNEEDYLSLFVNAFRMKYTTYLILCGTDLVGTCIIKDEDHIEFLRRCYDLDEVTLIQRHKRGYVGQIIHLVISPIFQPHVFFFMREIHRISEYSLLTYKIYSNESDFVRRSKSITVVIANLIPIKPKRGKMEEKYMNYPEYALYISTMYLSSLIKVEINNRITIVGSSIITTSFLENLIFNKSAINHIIFNNITVLAPHSAVTPKQMFKARDKFFIIHSEYLAKYVRMINLATYVNYSYGVMTGIDRKNNRLIVNSDSSIMYDILFLLCGVQFPNPLFSSLKSGDTVRNIYIVNTNDEATTALAKLKRQIYTTTKEKYNVIVYGQCLEVFTCVAALLEFGILGSNIVYIEPPLGTRHVVFPDSEVDAAVIDSMTNLGVRIYSGYKFIDCQFEESQHKASHSIFESPTHRLELECFAMFMYQDKCVSTKTFLAMNRAGLVFDGRLVIGPDFKTNDIHIYAAGTLTKYSRKYYANHMMQKYYNRAEIGEKLACQLFSKLLPNYNSDNGKITDMSKLKCSSNEANRDKLMPRFSRPRFEYCSLPGQMFYLHIRKPGLAEPIETQMTDDNYGEILSTGDCKKLSDQGYFKIHLNQYSIVETITCLSKTAIDYPKILSLYGKQERLLNNLILRCEMGLIADFYDYFNQDWMTLLFHNEYERCEINTMNALMKLKDPEGKKLLQILTEKLHDSAWKNLDESDRKYIRWKFNQANYKQVVAKHILNFIGDNLEDFPMYAHPVVVRMMLQSPGSPLFKEM